ncbi:HAMP domain-containing sensor histidine kinase [Paenibacillus sabinae]|nr:HAMP domain-containing sensor histidine kinase [Paenibacillus sabinae]
MARRFLSFRSKMILLLGFSMLLSGVVTFLLYKVLQYYYYENARAGDSLSRFRLMIRNVGDLNFFLIFFVPLAILVFFFLTKPYAVYFNEISAGIHRLASGDFKDRVQISSNDEFEKIAQDINLAGEKLQQAVERGDFAESSKDQLILNLAHDLRTPLTSVLGYLDFILRDRQLTADQVQHFASIAFTKSRRLEKLINELFEIAGMNHGKLAIQKKPLELSELLRQLNEELYPIFENHHLTARLSVPPKVNILGDGELLARVFENILTNAARYGRDGQFIDISCTHDEEAAIVQIVNYGDPIPEEERPYIFDALYSGDRSRTHQGGSTGLGLFIAKNIVEQHKGTISVQSDIIRTLFEVRLPK